MECATQLADGGAGADEEVDATQPPDDAARLESTQPANDGGHACARFVLVTNPREARNVVCDQFEVLWRHDAKVYLGREGPEEAAGSEQVVLCTSNVQGISRQHGWIRFDRQRGLEFTVCAQAGKAVTFLNDQPMAATAPTVVLKDGDMLGFGGASAVRPDRATLVYRAHFVGMPPLAQMPPPPEPQRAAGAKRGRQEMEGGASSEAPAGGQGQSKQRGGKKVEAAKRGKEAAASAAPPPAEAAATPGLRALHATAELQREHSQAIAHLDADGRRWASKFLAATSDAYGIARAAAAEGNADKILAEILRAQHKLSGLFDDAQAEVRRRRGDARTLEGQHRRRDRHQGQHGGRAQHRGGRGRGRGHRGGGGRGR